MSRKFVGGSPIGGALQQRWEQTEILDIWLAPIIVDGHHVIAPSGSITLGRKIRSALRTQEPVKPAPWCCKVGAHPPPRRPKLPPEATRVVRPSTRSLTQARCSLSTPSGAGGEAEGALEW